MPHAIARGTAARTYNRGRKFRPNPINAEDVALLLAACSPQSKGPLWAITAQRLRATVAILYRTGLRAKEFCDLVPEDLMHADHAILVRNGKGGKQRIVAVDAWGWREIEKWLLVRNELPEGALICQIKQPEAGSHLTTSYVRQALATLGQRAQLAKRIAPHQFRHGMAVELLRENVNLYAIQGQLGHANLRVTEIYFQGIDPLLRLKEISERRPPMILLPS